MTTKKSLIHLYVCYRQVVREKPYLPYLVWIKALLKKDVEVIQAYTFFNFFY